MAADAPTTPDTAWLENRLDNRPKPFLVRLGTQFFEEDIEGDDYSAPELKETILSDYSDDWAEFLRKYEKLDRNSISIRSAKEYLNQERGLGRDVLDVNGKYELLLVLHEHELEDVLDELIRHSRIIDKRSSRSYILDEVLELKNIKPDLRTFTKKWNNSDRLDAVRVKAEEEDEATFFEIYKEYGRRTQEVFTFREDNGDTTEYPNEPEIESISYYPLKKLRFKATQKDGETEIIFSDDYDSGWARTLNRLFDEVFGVEDVTDQLERKRSPIAEEIAEDVDDSVDEPESTTGLIQTSLSDRQEQAIEKVEAEGFPADEELDLVDRIESIELGGSDVQQDYSIGADQLRIVADLDDLFDSLSGMEASFEALLEKTAEENRTLVIKIQNRPVGVQGGTWSALGNGRLSDSNRTALEYFFGDA